MAKRLLSVLVFVLVAVELVVGSASSDAAPAVGKDFDYEGRRVYHRELMQRHRRSKRQKPAPGRDPSHPASAAAPTHVGHHRQDNHSNNAKTARPARPMPSPASTRASPAHHIRSPLPLPSPLTLSSSAAPPTTLPVASPTINTESKHPASASTVASVVAGACAAALAVSAALLAICRANRMGTVRPWATGLSGQLQRALSAGVPELKRSELELACEDFSNVIGSSIDYMAYKGTLSSGVEIAVISTTVASAKHWPTDDEARFRKKIADLSKFNHKNFINLLGYCADDRRFTRMMVFEYAPNGTLFEHLHIHRDEPLDWQMRARIAMGIAYCLEQMHQLDMLHILTAMDSSTVYLTTDFAAKVSGISFCRDEGYHRTLDAEEMTRKYGVLLLEILTGRIPVTKDGGISHWARCFVDGEITLKEMIDPSMRGVDGDTVDGLAQIVRSCIGAEGPRPTLPAVASLMREVTAMPPEAAAPSASPLWWAELELISLDD